MEADAAFNKLEMHFRALVSLVLFRVNDGPGFGSILQTVLVTWLTCFGFAALQPAFPCTCICNVWLENA